MGMSNGIGETKIGETKMGAGKEMWMLWEREVEKGKVNATTVGDGAILAGSAHQRARAKAKGIKEVEKVGAILAQALKEASDPPRVREKDILETHMGDMGTGIGHHRKGMGKAKEIGDKTNNGGTVQHGVQRGPGKDIRGNVGTVDNVDTKNGNAQRGSMNWEILGMQIRLLRRMRMQ